MSNKKRAVFRLTAFFICAKGQLRLQFHSILPHFPFELLQLAELKLEWYVLT